MLKNKSNNYKPTHYTSDNNTRYLLGKIGKRNALFIGINPSKADSIIPDPTIKKIIGFANYNRYDGWFVVNIYPQRSTNPTDLHKKLDISIVKKNKKIIEKLLRDVQINAIVACWGRLIISRYFLRGILLDIVKLKGLDKNKWVCIGKTLDGTPKHPSRHKYTKFKHFSLNKL